MNEKRSKALVCRTLGISRQSLYRTKRTRNPDHRNHPQDDANVVRDVRRHVDQRATYGYKRITGMINRERAALGLPRYNKKRIYRIMALHGLLLPKAEARLREGPKTGKIGVLHSNTRWCSDMFEIRCFSDERVYVAFALDCKDREMIEYVASEKPLYSQDIQDLMIGP